MSTAVMPGPHARTETAHTVLRALDQIAGTLALIDPDAVADLIAREKLDVPAPRLRLLAAARAFKTTLNPAPPPATPVKARKTAKAGRGQSGRG